MDITNYPKKVLDDTNYLYRVAATLASDFYSPKRAVHLSVEDSLRLKRNDVVCNWENTSPGNRLRNVIRILKLDSHVDSNRSYPNNGIMPTDINSWLRVSSFDNVLHMVKKINRTLLNACLAQSGDNNFLDRQMFVRLVRESINTYQ